MNANINKRDSMRRNIKFYLGKCSINVWWEESHVEWKLDTIKKTKKMVNDRRNQVIFKRHLEIILV